jgi:hypothetical protein
MGFAHMADADHIAQLHELHGLLGHSRTHPPLHIAWKFLGSPIAFHNLHKNGS